MNHNYNEEEINKFGIYRIYCKGNNKSYIGSARGYRSKNKKGFKLRLYSHVLKLNNNKHPNYYLQNAWNKYGKESFYFEILEFCDPQICDEKEIEYIEKYNSMTYQNGFNIIKQPLSNYAGVFTEEHRSKISNSLKGKNRPLSVKKKLGNPVLQYDLSGNFIKEYYSMSEASRQTGIQRQDIGQSIIGKKCKTAGGYIWKLKDKDIV